MPTDVQYPSAERRAQTVKLGMWVFLASESLLFAGLFAVFAAYRHTHAAEFAAAQAHADVTLGSINTYILLTSSLTVALAPRRPRVFFAITLALGAAFLALKGIEYGHHLADGFAPGWWYSSTELPARGHVLYFTLYYLLTGLHALHVLAGMCVLAVLWWRPRNQTALECGTLYWHLVDLVWVFLWPVLYLIK